MALIKAQSASSLLKEAIVLDLGDLGRQAAKVQAAMEAKARQTLADAQQAAAKIIEEAKSKGFDEGRGKGFEQGLAEGRKQGRAEALAQTADQLRQLQESWTAAASQWEVNRSTLESEGSERLLEMALRLAEKIVHRVIEIDPSVVVDQVATSLSHVLREFDVIVRIAPQDRPVLEEALPQLLAEFSHLKHVRLVDDPAVGAGGCILTYGQGQVDATIDTQLRRVVELMLPGDSTINEQTEPPRA